MAEAVAAFEQAIEAAPLRADYRSQLARCLSVLNQDAEALNVVDEALSLEPADPLTLDTLGVVLARSGAHGRAAGLFQQAVLRAPENPGFQYNLASSLRFMGDASGAERAFEASVSHAPRLYRAHSALAEIRRHGPDDNHIARLLRLLPGVGGDIDGELHLRHALAREYEDLGDYVAAFRHFALGRARKRQAVGYTFAADAALFETVLRVFDADFCGRPIADTASAAPIFVVGMPRTGTTLVERILSAHSEVTSAGELPSFGLCVKRATGSLSRLVLEPATIESAAALDCRELGRRYLEITQRVARGTPHFVDKMPINFFYLGLICRALPNAKIVCLERDALDTCIGNFRQLFAADFPYYRYAYDLHDIADYFVGFRRLLTHWENVLPRALLRVRYETLVRKPGAEIRRLLEFCGLPPEPACYTPHTNPAPVATASAVQVRDPLYTGSIGRWRHYAAALASVCPRLEAAGIDIADAD